MFRRRIFYDETGEVLRSYVMDGRIIQGYTVEQEKADLGLTGCDCMEWAEPDPEIEAAFADVDETGAARAVEVSVDVSGEAPQLVFEYTPLEGLPEGEDPFAIIDILTGGEV